MTTAKTDAATTLAAQILDAQVRWTIAQLTADDLPERITALVDDLLAVADTVTVGDLIDPEEAKTLVRLALTRFPASTAATTLAESAGGILHDNPAGEYTLRELIGREQVEQLTDELLALTPTLERALDDLTRSPLVAGLASRFVGRLVNDVVAGNRAVAEKIPGVGGLVSFGAGVAGKAIGKTGEQIGDLFGDTAAKGTEFAMGRLNKIIVATLNDPQMRVAALEVFDLYADRPAGQHEAILSPEDAQRLAGLGQDIAITATASEPFGRLADAFVDGFFATYADHRAAVLLEDLSVAREDLVTHALAIGPRLVDAVADSGELERMIADRLAPFYASPEVLDLLGG